MKLKEVSTPLPDVLVVDGGRVAVPGPVDFGFDYGLPPGLTFGCMAETMALTLEGRFEEYTVGKDLSLEKVMEIRRIAERHGFRPAPLLSFNQPVAEGRIQAVRNARRPVRSDTEVAQ